MAFSKSKLQIVSSVSAHLLPLKKRRGFLSPAAAAAGIKQRATAADSAPSTKGGEFDWWQRDQIIGLEGLQLTVGPYF